jgi:hypothetical protein
MIKLYPEDVFGGRKRGTPIMVPGDSVQFRWDANKGQAALKTQKKLKPIKLASLFEDYDFRLNGSRLSVKFDCETEEDLKRGISLLFYLPLYLSLFLGQAVMINSFRGTVGGCEFNLEVISGKYSVQLVDEERQTEQTRAAVETLVKEPSSEHPRVLAAVGYLYTALLLWTEPPYSSAFMPEVALNLCKVLDVLFTDSRDCLRSELKKLGYQAAEIEKGYVLLTLIRNQLDIAHPSLFIPTEDERRMFDSFIDVALVEIQKVVKKVIELSAVGEYEILPYDTDNIDKDREELIGHLNKYRGFWPSKRDSSNVMNLSRQNF